MSELVSEATQAEEGGFCAEVNAINRNHYQRAAPTNLRLDPLFGSPPALTQTYHLTISAHGGCDRD